MFYFSTNEVECLRERKIWICLNPAHEILLLFKTIRRDFFHIVYGDFAKCCIKKIIAISR